MESNSNKLKAIFMGALCFNLIFWQEKMGLNVLLFDLLIGLSLYLLYPKIWKEKPVMITGICTLLMALLVVWNNTLFSKAIHLLSVGTCIGFVQVRGMKFIGTAFWIGISSLLESPLKALLAFATTGMKVADDNSNMRPAWRWAQLSVLPLLLVSIFYSLYAMANPAFAKLSGQFWSNVSTWAIPDIDIYKILFFLAGLFIVTAIIWPTHLFAEFKESFHHKVLKRLRGKGGKKGVQNFKLLDLKMEYRSALILMTSLNVLLFFVNAIDFWYVWLGNGQTEAILLSQYVHEGTWLLIIAIFLGMIILGYYFRKNLNFYPENTLLKKAAYFWIIQNGVLALSVGMRNFRYIEHYGLAYKRLGVILFLTLVLVGLVTMYFKVYEKKTFYYLLFQNAWACYFILILASSINWDVAITRYNLSGKTKTEVDKQYLIDGLSEKNLFVLNEYYSSATSSVNLLSSSFRFRLEKKQKKFELQQKKYSWLSWNYSDFRNKR